MTENSTSQCPFQRKQSGSTAPLRGHDLRWDAAEHAGLLAPKQSSEVGDLADCARAAWRNSVRCIGRRRWKALKVIDARHLARPDEIFEAIVDHLRLATNNGNILPVMTIFPEWLPDGPEIRVWNHQVLRYAGYRNPDGSFVGDPMNIRLTDLAISLGWRPPSEPDAFDLLPLIIQVGQELRCFELPKREILEVRIRHPRHHFMESMNLRWYAVPLVSDMMFATGASVHTCAPFNGYYLGTEIGARNLADTDRYNLLPEVATKLGLDTRDPHNLWKDHALVALNEAVLWSFDEDGIRITDHHTASDDFQRFCEQERKAGRQASAEWSWIVPPISGAATSVFHQRFNMEPEFPNFLLQTPPWETERGRRALDSQMAETPNSSGSKVGDTCIPDCG